MSYRIAGLNPSPFEPWFAMTDAQLLAQGARRLTVDDEPGFPCRVSLEDAKLGEQVIALSYQHQPAASPYRASGPIFLRQNISQATVVIDRVPKMLTLRPQSIRAYDDSHFIRAAEIAAGDQVDDAIRGLLSDQGISYLHVHNAKPGCFNCRVDRV